MKTTNLQIKTLSWLFASMIFLSANHANATCSGSIVISTSVSEPLVASFCDVSITNTGTISASLVGILNSYNTITTINNTGTISAQYGVYNVGTLTTLNNTGTISAQYGVYNVGTLTTLNNLQGASGSALTFARNLPTNYNIIISSANVYGQLSTSNVTGNTVFNIYGHTGQTLTSGVSASSVTNNHLYQNVLTGLVGTLSGSTITGTGFTITGATGTYGVNNYSYSLVADDNQVSGTWDLLFSSLGPSSTDTQSSLNSLAPKLRTYYTTQSIATNFANMNTYDCDLFDAKGVCVSVGGQQTYVDNPSANMTSTVVVAGYKVSPNVRIGGFLNQNINNNTVSGVHISNANPLMGVFAVWNQNENRLGYQVKIANAYQDKDVTTTRDVFGTSEAGTGSTTLNTQSYVGELSYAYLANQEKTLVRPYAALRYTRIKQDGYTEQTSAGVTAPLTYSALADRSTTALLGLKLNHKIAEKVNLTGSLGIEQDLNHHVDNLTATGVLGLTSENFNDSIKRTRPVASIGAYYMPVKNQRIAADLYYQQLPFQSTGSATAYVNYTIGF